MQRLKAAFALSAVAGTLLTATAANARPAITLKLQGLVVSKSSDGSEKTIPIEQQQPAPGQTIRYLIVASNGGSDAAKYFSSVGKIPTGTSYVPGSAQAPAARVEFSLDNGKTWAAKPTVAVHTPQGDVRRAADPGSYTAVRYVADAALAAKSSETFAYSVRVK